MMAVVAPSTRLPRVRVPQGRRAPTTMAALSSMLASEAGACQQRDDCEHDQRDADEVRGNVAAVAVVGGVLRHQVGGRAEQAAHRVLRVEVVRWVGVGRRWVAGGSGHMLVHSPCLMRPLRCPRLMRKTQLSRRSCLAWGAGVGLQLSGCGAPPMGPAPAGELPRCRWACASGWTGGQRAARAGVPRRGGCAPGAQPCDRSR